MKISFVELENYYPIKIAKWLENAFLRFESVYRPEKNEIVLRTMKSERGSDEIFGVPPQMKLNPPPSPAEGGFLPPSADLVEKSTCLRKCFFL